MVKLLHIITISLEVITYNLTSWKASWKLCIWINEWKISYDIEYSSGEVTDSPDKDDVFLMELDRVNQEQDAAKHPNKVHHNAQSKQFVFVIKLKLMNTRIVPDIRLKKLFKIKNNFDK